MALELEREAQIREVLSSARTVAVLGAHVEPGKPAFYVPDYLASQGYRILPVNPGFVGRSQWGEPFRASLAEIGEPVDLVDVFRRAEHLPGHLDDILALDPRPRTVWLQLGIRHPAVAARLVEAGIDVVQDLCTMAEHRALGLPAV
ncbi:MAG: CoA-binding protein [Thermoanaerobaculia bacterium]